MKLQSATPEARSDDPEKALLDSLAGLAGERALILGLNIEIMCGLIQRGCREVTEIERDDHPEPGSIDVVVVPSVGTAAAADRAIALAQRSLANFGRIALRTAHAPSSELGHAIIESLRRHGFFLTDIRAFGDRTVYVATSVRRGQ